MIMLGGGDWATNYLEADDRMVRGKNGEKRVLSPELTVGGLKLNFNPNGEGSQTPLHLSHLTYLTLLI